MPESAKAANTVSFQSLFPLGTGRRILASNQKHTFKLKKKKSINSTATFVISFQMEELRNHLDFFTQDFQSFLESIIIENKYGECDFFLKKRRKRRQFGFHGFFEM